MPYPRNPEKKLFKITTDIEQSLFSCLLLILKHTSVLVRNFFFSSLIDFHCFTKQQYEGTEQTQFAHSFKLL